MKCYLFSWTCTVVQHITTDITILRSVIVVLYSVIHVDIMKLIRRDKYVLEKTPNVYNYTYQKMNNYNSANVS